MLESRKQDKIVKSFRNYICFVFFTVFVFFRFLSESNIHS